ncbi:MAG: RidA family protein [Methylococcales bacterium]
MAKTIIQTPNAPKAIGTYSQAVKIDNTVYLSGQIPLNPATMSLVEGDISVHITQVFENIRAVAIAAGGDLADIVKLNVFLTDLAHFPIVNEIMKQYFHEPYPARAAVEVAALPKNAEIEMDAIMVLQGQEYY